MHESQIPILWTFRRCPYAMRTRLAIKASGVSVYLREILLRAKPAEFIRDSAKATVPVLKLSSGEVLEESIDIMHWALAQNDPNNWRDVLDTRNEYSTLFLDELDGTFKKNLDRYKYASRYGLESEDALAFRDEGVKFLNKINDSLGSNPYLSGKQQGFLDVASLPFVRQFRIANPTWFDRQNWPHLHHWLQTFITSNQLSIIMEKLTPWDANQGHGILF